MRQIISTFKFEYLGYVKSRSYIITTVIFLLISVGITCVPNIIRVANGGLSVEENSSEAQSQNIGFYDSTKQYSDEELQPYMESIGMVFVESTEQGVEGVKQGVYTSFVELNDSGYTITYREKNVALFGLDSEVKAMATDLNVSHVLKEEGASQEDIDKLLGFEPMGQLISIETEATGGSQAEIEAYSKNIAYVYVLLFLLYLTLIMYGQLVAVSVIREKSSKAVELLITSIKPSHLMFGKVLGACSAGLTQFFIIFTGSFVSFKLNALLYSSVNAQQVLSGLEPSSPMIFVYLLIFFILGFLFYSFLYAGFASTASRMDEANSVMAIPMIFLVSAFIIAMGTIGNPSGNFSVVASYIPCFTPMVMFVRVCLGSASNLEAIISIIIMILSIIGVGFMSAKIYRTSILMYGNRPKLLSVIKMVFKAKV